MPEISPAEREQYEGVTLAPALYPPTAVTQRDEGFVEVIGRPVRGEVHLVSAYTPAWWYAVCSKCYDQIATSRNPIDPMLQQQAQEHRCII